MFKQLAYQFRVAMKLNDILPITMRNREDCYYGKQCRTQYTKPGHAQKLNHACEQTKFSI
jgi:E3 ubiquitin-protein ligase CHFR